MIDPTVRAQAKFALADAMGGIITTAREGLSFTRQLRAQAEPILSLIEGAEAELKRITQTQTQIDDALATLEPYREINEIAILMGVLEAMKTLLIAMIATETARKALALLVVPSPNALGAAAVVVIARKIENQIEEAIRNVVDTLEES
jgi:hypothetical protein